MLLSEESLTNSELARRLNVSQAAVTKAIKSLIKEGMLETSKDPKDARVIFYQLTDLARPIAEEHHHHHEHTLSTYEQVASQFSAEEQQIIQRFFNCFSRRNQVMRYITVEDLSSIMTRNLSLSISITVLIVGNLSPLLEKTELPRRL